MATVATMGKGVVVDGVDSVTEEQLTAERETVIHVGDKIKQHAEILRPDEIVANDELNMRVAKGQKVAGVMITNELRNFEEMVEVIRTMDGLPEPLMVSRRKDKSMVLLRGFRRMGAIRLLAKEGGPLGKKLMEGVPCTVYEGLTEEQERDLVNDQRSQKFSQADVCRRYFEELDGGHNWFLAAMKMRHQIAETIKGGDKRLKEIEAVKDLEKRRVEYRKWFSTNVYITWATAWKHGPFATNLWLQTYLWDEGYTKTPPMARIDYARFRKVYTEIGRDQKNNEWDRVKGGPRTLKLLTTLGLEDDERRKNGGRKVRTGEVKKKTRPIGEIDDLMKSWGEETLASRILKLSMPDQGDIEAVKSIKKWENVLDLWKHAKAKKVPAELREALDIVCGDKLDVYFEANTPVAA